MSDIVIKAEGLGKKYLIGHQSERESYTALRDVLTRNVKSVLHKTRQVLSGQQLLAGDEIEEFWALRDIDFEIKRGDRVGIIGRNGAGKSTLLKILSRITEPSAGRVEIRGRVASLLEVGTGFHPELTGRENIYLNGAILGMTRAEIKKKFDEIVDFAGVEKFLDTPVKRYSSGMYVRLAFAVAAHLEPEILVVDEVLAVGDAEFQKKCLGKMEDVSKNDGRTVLFVSHNQLALRGLCSNGLLLANGHLLNEESIEKCLEYYNLGILDKQKFNLFQEPKKLINGELIVFYIKAYNEKSSEQENCVFIDKRINLEINYEIVDFEFSLGFCIEVFTTEGICLFKSNSECKKMSNGKYVTVFEIGENFFNKGKYRIDLYIIEGDVHVIDSCKEIFFLDLEEHSRNTVWVGEWKGVVKPLLKIKTLKI